MYPRSESPAWNQGWSDCKALLFPFHHMHNALGLGSAMKKLAISLNHADGYNHRPESILN